MVNGVMQLRSINFSKLKLPRFDYADQTKISHERVNLATACVIHYGLNTGMVVRYLKGKYVGESRDADAITKKVSPYIDDVNCEHIKQVINLGCPSHINFEEDYNNKCKVLQKGNQQTFLQFPEVTAKAMNKEKKRIATSWLLSGGWSISHPTAERRHRAGHPRKERKAQSHL
jgi:hypothetical protein